MKNFSDAGIYSSLNKLQMNFTIKPILYTLYQKLGIFLDLRCHNSTESKYLLTKVSKVSRTVLNRWINSVTEFQTWKQTYSILNVLTIFVNSYGMNKYVFYKNWNSLINIELQNLNQAI